MRKLCKKQLESHWTLSPQGTVRDSSGPLVPSCTGARPKNEQNLIHSERKVVPDRFTPYSRFREIYNGKRCYHICARDVCVGHRRCPSFFFFLSRPRIRKKRLVGRNGCANSIESFNVLKLLLWIFKDNSLFV